jgi:parvulin-like peptidyl-prolyl isomerase
MKKAILAAVIMVLLLPTLVLGGCSKDVPAGAIAAVGDGVVTQEQFDEIWSQAQAQYKSQGVTLPKEGTSSFKQIKASIVSFLVQNEVIAQAAVADSVNVKINGEDVSVDMNVKVTDKELQERIKLLKTQVGGEKKFTKLLKQQGYTEAALKEQLKASMLQSKVQEKVLGEIKVTDEQMQQYFDKNEDQFKTDATVDARHVLVKTQAEANKVRSLLAADSSDANWKAVAEEYSTDTSTKKSGGDLGSFPKGRMVKDFENAAFDLKVDEISQPVKTQYGWHVIQVTKKTPASKQTFKDAKATIEQTLLATEQQTVWSAFIDQAVKDADVAYAAGFSPDELTASPSASASPSATE